MAVRHMTDDDLQAYLEKGTSTLDQVFDAHLAECRECRTRIEEYRQLFEAMSVDRGFDLPAGFAGTVAARVQQQRAADGRRRWQNLLLVLASAVIAGGGLAYFMDLRPLLTRLDGIFTPSIEQSAAVLNQAGQRVASSGDTFLTILFCGLIIIAVAGADHLLFRTRHAKYSL